MRYRTGGCIPPPPPPVKQNYVLYIKRQLATRSMGQGVRLKLPRYYTTIIQNVLQIFKIVILTPDIALYSIYLNYEHSEGGNDKKY